jgi:hypothetical protein
MVPGTGLFLFFHAMYAARVIQKIRKLLKQGFKQTWIAGQVGCSVCTVQRVATGKIAPYRKEDAKLKAEARQAGICPRHGKLKLPCVACAAEKFRRLHPEIDWSQADPPPNNDERDRRRTLEQWQFVHEVEFRITKGYE